MQPNTKYYDFFLFSLSQSFHSKYLGIQSFNKYLIFNLIQPLHFSITMFLLAMLLPKVDFSC